MPNQFSRERYAAKFPKSEALFERAKGTFPRGVPHDGWNVSPFPIFMTRAKGSHVWDVDGYDYIDYYGGHGGKVLGHAHPAVVEAAKKQIENGIQYGSCCDLSLEWAELVKRLVPSAERVEFTNSGTEAVMMGIRMARAFTGRSKIVRFQLHYSGGHDAVLVGYKKPFDIPFSAGLLHAAVKNTVVIPANNENALEDSLRKRDVAALMVEAAGSSSGEVGIKPSFYQTMRDLTTKYDTLLFFDEVVTGFRYSPGGVQAALGVVPDLTALGKGVNGVVPGAGAIVGCKDVMNMLLFKDDDWNRYKRVSHFGTFNANPFCAATGIAYLEIIATGGFSVLHVYFGNCDLRGQCDRTVCLNAHKVRPPDVGEALYMNLALNGVKPPPHGYDFFVSAVHTREDIDNTIEAFGISLEAMVEENKLPK